MDFSGVPALRSLSSLMGGADDPDTEETPEPETDGGVATVGGQATKEVEIPAGTDVALSVPENADVDAEAIEQGLPEGAAESVAIVQGQTNDGDGMTVNPIAESDSKRLGGYFSELFTEFDRIQDPKIEKLRENRVDYNERVGKWILTEDDRVPAILNNQVGLILGQRGLQCEPEDPDNDADVKTAEFLQDLYDGEHEDLPHVDPRNVTRQIMAQNYLSARSVLRSTDLAELPLESLTYYRDPEDSTEYYVQDAMSYKKLEPDPDAAGGFRTTRDSTDEQLLELGEHVFDAHLFRTKPLKAIADLVVNKMVLQRLMARKAEIASVGGLYVKVEPPAWLSESAYEDQVEDPENDGETISKLELHMREGVNDAFETLQDYQSGFIMSIPSHWTVEQIEVPETGEPMADQIRAYNKSIAARLMFPLDLMELREGAELSRDTLFRTLLNTIAGWRREVLGVFDEFARVQKEIHDLNGDVTHSLPKLETEDEELLIQALNFAGLAGMSTKEIRQTFNRIEGFDLDEQAPEDPAQQQGGPAPGGPQDPSERQRQMQEILNPDDDEDDDPEGGDAEEDGEDGDDVQASRSDLLDAFAQVDNFTPPEGLDLYELEGWDQTSVWDAFLSLGGTHRTCSKRMRAELRNPDAWCAALKDQALGTDLWRKGSGAFAGDEEPTVYAQEAADYEFDGSLDDFADAVESVLGDVTRLQSEDDYVAFSPGGAEPGDDGFSPVVVIDAGDGEFQISGASEDDLSGLDERLGEASAASAVASHALSGFDSARQAAQHVRDVVSEQVPDGHTTDMKRVEDGRFGVYIRDDAGDFAGSLVVSETDDGTAHVVRGNEDFFQGVTAALRAESAVTDAVTLHAGFRDLTKAPVIPDDPERITKEMLVDWVMWVRAGRPQPEVAARGFNPELHPRDPVTGRFIERPWSLPDSIDQDSIRATPTLDLLDELKAAGEPIENALADDRISIDGIPDDVNSVDEARERLGGDGLVFQDLENGDAVEIVTDDGQLTKGTIDRTEVIDGGPNRAHVVSPSGSLHVVDVGEGTTIRRESADVGPEDLSFNDISPGDHVQALTSYGSVVSEGEVDEKIVSDTGTNKYVVVDGVQHSVDTATFKPIDPEGAASDGDMVLDSGIDLSEMHPSDVTKEDVMVSDVHDVKPSDLNAGDWVLYDDGSMGSGEKVAKIDDISSDGQNGLFNDGDDIQNLNLWTPPYLKRIGEAPDDDPEPGSTGSPGTHKPDAPSPDADVDDLTDNPNTDPVDVTEADLNHPATKEGDRAVGVLDGEVVEEFIDFLSDPDEGEAGGYDVIRDPDGDMETSSSYGRVEYPQANAYSLRNHARFFAGDTDEIPAEGSDVERFIEQAGSWKSKSYSDVGQAIEKRFHAALDLPGDFRNDGLDGDDPTEGEAAASALFTAATQEFVRQNFAQFEQRDDWGVESGNRELPLYRGVGRHAVASLARDWAEDPESDSYSMKESKIGNFSVDPDLADNWGEMGTVIKKNAEPEEMVFSPDVMTGDLTDLEREGEIWLTGGVTNTDPANIQVNAGGPNTQKTLADLPDSVEDMEADELQVITGWAGAMRSRDELLESEQQIRTFEEAYAWADFNDVVPQSEAEKIYHLVNESRQNLGMDSMNRGEMGA